MYHKHLVDERVRSALKEGQASQEAARAFAAARRRRPGFLRRLFTHLFARPARQDGQPAHRSPQARLSRQP